MDNPRNTDNSGYTRNKDKQVQTLEKTKGGIRNGQSKKHWQLWVHKTQDEDKQAQTLEKAKVESGMDNPRNTGNSGYTRHRTKTNKYKR